MKSKLNPKKEFNIVMNKITRGFMLERCKLYKVQHRKNEDTLVTLCLKYLRKLDKMQPWDIPDDEYGNAGFVNPDRILEDDAIRLKVAEQINHPDIKKFEEVVKNRIDRYIKEVEQIELTEKYKKDIRKR